MILVITCDRFKVDFATYLPPSTTFFKYFQHEVEADIADYLRYALDKDDEVRVTFIFQQRNYPT